MRYAAKTGVGVDRSRAEIERNLSRYGATKFAYFSEQKRACIAFEIAGKRIRFVLALPDRAEFSQKRRYGSMVSCTPEEQNRMWDQACRQSWRALNLIIKAKLEWVESMHVTVEEEFMPYIVLPTGKTVAETLIPELNQLYATGRIPRLLPEGVS